MAEQSAKDTSPASETLSSRVIAHNLLMMVLERGQALDNILERDEKFLELSTRDKAFVRMLVATTLRRTGQLDDMIKKASGRDDAPTPPALHHLLRMAATQIVFMNVPDYAVVDTAVAMSEELNLGRSKGFVNAVLRRITENHHEWITKQDEARLNTPQWLMQSWIEDYELRVAAEIAQANLSEAPLDISLKNPSEMEHWAEELDATILPTGTLRTKPKGAIQNLPGFKDGMWWVQDASASLPAQLFGDIAGANVLDMCAAPGGKTAQLLTMGASVTALDRSSARLKRLEENLKRLRLKGDCRLELADASEWHSAEKFEYILLDAPCSATGTIRRHPDVMYLKKPLDVERLVDVQRRLLNNALNMLVPGGVLIYCTCSLQKTEGENQIDTILSEHTNVRRLPLSSLDVGGLDIIVNEQGDIRVLPFHMAVHGGMDGFYISRLQKN